jgi:hypothetical protein
MKILQDELKSLQDIAHQNGCSWPDFQLVKKRGKLNISHSDIGSTFIFFRKTKSHLNSHGKFDEVSTYFVNAGSKLQNSTDWEMVMQAFNEWLKPIKQN